MSEIEKMYENAGVELTEGLEWVCKNPDHCIGQNLSVVPENCTGCEHFKREMRYPPFTAEKLINLEMFLINKGDFDIKKGSKHITFESFTSCIAGLINNLWQDLTEEEKQQVKGILE